MVNDVKITVVANLKPEKIFSEMAAEGVDAVCEVKTGTDYISRGLEMPDGFCSWAWADIHRDVAHLALGGDFPWIKESGKMVSCCTDGLRPVIFKLERI